MNRKLKEIIKQFNCDLTSLCPNDLICTGSTTGAIVLREGLKYICPTPLVKVATYLYDLNIQTISCGSNNPNEIGIEISYDSLSEYNKKLADKFMGESKQNLCPASVHTPHNRFRISIEVDFENDTIVQAQEKIMKKVQGIGFSKQDVLYGFMPLKDRFAEYSWLENCSVDDVIGENQAYEDDTFWFSKELLAKHKEYLQEQINEGEENECN